MSEEGQFECTGYISSVEKGRFEDQFNVEVESNDGAETSTTKAQVYKTKQDGTESKVWPLITDSFANNKILTWTGRSKEVETQHGSRTYHTITWGKEATNAPPGPLTTELPKAAPTPIQSNGITVSLLPGMEVAMWAVGTAVSNLGQFPEAPTDPVERREFIITKAIALASMAQEVSSRSGTISLLS